VKDPLGEKARFAALLEQVTPGVWMTPLLVGLNVLVFVVMLAKGVSPTSRGTADLRAFGANYGPLTATEGQWWRLVTCQFVHIGVIHILMNMLVLWQIGRFTERLFGQAGFLVLYIASGIFGAVASMQWNPVVTSAGASGAIFGLYGGLAGFLVMSGSSIPRQVLADLGRGIAAMVIFNILFAFKGGIDQAAHIGGLVGGFLGGLALGQPVVPGMETRRFARDAVVLALGLTAFGGAIAGARRPVAVDLPGAFREFAAVEEPALRTFVSLQKKLALCELDGPEFANRIDTEVLAPWVMATDRLAALTEGSLSPQEARLLDAFLRYCGARRTSFEQCRDGARQGDRALYDSGQTSWRESDAIIAEIKGMASPR
jgi:rhomboid protease GluP